MTPGLASGFDAVRGTLVRLVVTMGIIFSAGVIGNFIYTRAMAIVTQGTLKHMRDDMFDSMERLPLRFFDTHPHGAIMSTYTNDTDAIRQLIGQSIPTLIQSGLTIIVLIGTMLYYSVSALPRRPRCGRPHGVPDGQAWRTLGPLHEGPAGCTGGRRRLH